MVSPCVPGQLRDETVVLVPVVVVVGQNEVRHEARFEVLEGFLDELALEGKNPSRNPLMTMSLLVLVPAKKTSAERRASSTRTGLSPASTTHFTSSSGWSLAKCKIVPPAPISMSSQWAPRQSRRFTRVRSRTESMAARVTCRAENERDHFLSLQSV